MSPIFTSGLPLLRSINAVSLTKSKGFIRHSSDDARTGVSISAFLNIVTLTRRKRRSPPRAGRGGKSRAASAGPSPQDWMRAGAAGGAADVEGIRWRRGRMGVVELIRYY